MDVGSGSGYMSACLAYLVQPHGQVYGVEHISELVGLANANIINSNSELLPRIHLTSEYMCSWIHFVNYPSGGDGFAGLPQHGPYDAIYVGAAAECMSLTLMCC